MVKPVRKAVFPLGGLGTRFLPATKAIPKEMLTVVDKPLIQYAVEEAEAAGIERFIFVTGRDKSAIEDHFDTSHELEETLLRRQKTAELEAVRALVPAPGRLAYTRQPSPLGLGHAVWCARELVGDEPFAVLLADDLVVAEPPCLKQLIDVYAKTGGNVVAVAEIPPEETPRYGVLEVGDDDGRLAEVKGLVEKPDPASAPSTLGVIGRYVLHPEVFACLGDQNPGAGAEIQLTDGLARLIAKVPSYGLRFDGVRFDCGSKIGFLEANLALALAREDLRDEVRAVLGRYR